MSIFGVGVVGLLLAIGAEDVSRVYGVAVLVGVMLVMMGSRVLMPDRITADEFPKIFLRCVKYIVKLNYKILFMIGKLMVLQKHAD
ncbi:hypothetical protein [Massilia rubra]|uniref:Uncharacterized protein n=1 Tax=Massilia rubra TaxID=2607910 RepID=A0ABX0LRN5_9BURK|nr:hypothetical protein [Massilia rubra]NHZ34832.1 hypothetical protein [Massilia rubra]